MIILLILIIIISCIIYSVIINRLTALNVIFRCMLLAVLDSMVHRFFTFNFIFKIMVKILKCDFDFNLKVDNRFFQIGRVSVAAELSTTSKTCYIDNREITRCSCYKRRSLKSHKRYI